MYIRQKVKTTKSQTYFQHQLLKSIRTPSGPRQEVVLNLGFLDLPKDEWKNLANAIEEKLNNQMVLSFSKNSQELEKLADHFAQMIISKEMNKEKECAASDAPTDADRQQTKKDAASPEQQRSDFERVDINSIKTTESKSIGSEYILSDQMDLY